MAVASLGMFASPLVRFLEPISSVLGFSPAGLFGLITMMILVAITIQLSISISGIQRQNRRLAEETARLRNQFEKERLGQRTQP